MTTLDRRWVDENGIVFIRFRKPDGGWHRTSVEPGQDVDKTMEAVNAHLERMGHTKIGRSDLDVIRNTIAIEHKPEVVAKFRSERDKQR